MQACLVFPAEDVFVAQGVNAGDSLSLPDDICPGDHYELEAGSRALRLMVQGSGAAQTVADGSDLGQPGDPVKSLARYTLMDDRAYQVDLLLLQIGPRLCALPLSPMTAGTEYVLLKAEAAPGEARLSDVLCLSFGRGTMITRPDGRQQPIETLAAGDPVLTRDHGTQPLRWVGRTTMRAIGPFAPVVITAGVLGNAGDLIVSQQHRMFLYRHQRPEGGTSELLVQARHLVNGGSVFLREGGFTDYFALVFDRHEIIFAEGIAAESLLITEATISRLPPELSADMRTRFPGLTQTQHFGTEVERLALDQLRGVGRPTPQLGG